MAQVLGTFVGVLVRFANICNPVMPRAYPVPSWVLMTDIAGGAEAKLVLFWKFALILKMPATCCPTSLSMPVTLNAD